MLPNVSFSFCPAPLSCCSRCSSWRPPSLPSFPLRAPVRSARCVCTSSDIIISYRWKHMWLSIKVFAQGRAKHRRHKSLLLCGCTDVFSSLETCRCSHTTQTSAVCSARPLVCVTESSHLTLAPFTSPPRRMSHIGSSRASAPLPGNWPKVARRQGR